MKKNKIKFTIIGVCIVATLILTSFTTMATQNEKNNNINNRKNIISYLDDIPYTGFIKIYVVEKTSRWRDADNKPYHYALLDFAYEQEITLEYLEGKNIDVVWKGEEAGFSHLNENNLMVIAAVFNSVPNIKYAYPPSRNPFNAYYVDASAGASSGTTGYNIQKENFTHTVFVEEGTATWCQYCPAMSEALNSVYESNEYPFYFVAMVEDENEKAKDRLSQHYNIAGYPTAFFDGGYTVLVGGYDEESYYENKIISSGRRDAHDLNLTLNVQWQGNGILDIKLDITNLEEITNYPPETPTITGTPSGNPGTEYEYNIISNDPDNDKIYYIIEWGDGNPEETIGPHFSNQNVQASHIWNEKGTYLIKVKARDVLNAESDWATFEVSMPRSKHILKSENLIKKLSWANKDIYNPLDFDNTPPNPPVIEGPFSGQIDEIYEYNITITDPDENIMFNLEIDFGDGVVTENCGCGQSWESGTVVQVAHKWKKSGDYEIKARVQDSYGEWSEWSEPNPMIVPKQFSFEGIINEFFEKHLFQFNLLKTIFLMILD